MCQELCWVLYIFISVSLNLRKEVIFMPILQIRKTQLSCPHPRILLPLAGSFSSPCSPSLCVPLYFHQVGTHREGKREESNIWSTGLCSAHTTQHSTVASSPTV